MIRKENIDIKELNRKVHSQAQLKPSLDAFPVKDFSVPFNSLKNTHGIMNAELEIPQSFLDNNIGVTEQINNIKNNQFGENLELQVVEEPNINNTKEQIEKLIKDIEE